MSHPLHILDVFAREPYTGNQLAVVTDAGDLTDERMQAVAAEMDYSETTFVTGPPDEGAWPVRIFTPTAEIPFAGHPTLGTAAVVRDHLADGQPETVTLDLDVGEIPVSVDATDGRERFWMRQRPPAFGDRLDHDALAEVLGLPADALDSAWPVQVVSTGLPTIVVPLGDRDALAAIDLDRAAYDRVTGGRDAKNVLAFCPDPREADNDLAARVFAPFYDVPEDPATGSSNGCLAAYLARYEYFGGPSVAARVEQGHEMGRPSLLHLDADATGDPVDVEVGGGVVPVVRGALL
ncbi:PhzF family phenazine biosynthesis protein [Haloarcula sp. S1CR25-12]|uniref:PhzF family phenazine biosynthesis protein n=1 Tax=Haloarcula saliterrae TaxID=2950534 RepID=A0ABU2FCS9_9EURY|nr:PhzF family phenazine biosynthesis protein [Haloarcula sp. S1CR25-12]MDS0260063.1 PhzF family phenazine biosynthesis protein [Haloarcula sp. S1CR25-12]